MPFDVDPRAPRPVYVQIMDGIRRGIVLGEWRPGEALPAARDLAIELRVNPNTVQRAYRELEREGVVRGRRGSGTFVTANVQPEVRRKLARSLAERFAAEAYAAGISVPELIRELRGHSGDAAQEIEQAV